MVYGGHNDMELHLPIFDNEEDYIIFLILNFILSLQKFLLKIFILDIIQFLTIKDPARRLI